MFTLRTPARLLAIALLGIGLRSSVAGEAFHFFGPPKEPPTRHFPPRERSFEKAGNPHLVSNLAHPSYSERYWGYYVGGGAPGHFGHGRRCDEGTWGWDYIGHGNLIPRVMLGWSHGRKYQGGLDYYKTDGPKFFQGIGGAIHSAVHSHSEGGEGGEGGEE